MGGLKKDLPITYWTFLIGALAIAGVPLLSGFFSKDEILFKTFVAAATRHACGSSALLTSLLTAIYMFRLVFLTFHGERRHAARCAHAGHAHDDAPCRARSRRTVTATAHLHDAPPAMAFALIVLAIGSVAGRLHRHSARARRPQPHRSVPRAGLRGAQTARRARRRPCPSPKPARRPRLRRARRQHAAGDVAPS